MGDFEKKAIALIGISSVAFLYVSILLTFYQYVKHYPKNFL